MICTNNCRSVTQIKIAIWQFRHGWEYNIETDPIVTKIQDKQSTYNVTVWRVRVIFMPPRLP